MIFVNFKTYRKAAGEKAVALAKTCQEVREKTGIKIIPIVQTVDLWRIRQKVKIPLWVQHVDWQEEGKFTGFINPEALIQAGVSGTLLNHSEHRLSFAVIEKTVARIKQLKEEFKVMICAKNLKEIVKLKRLKPDFLAYEAAELIASKTRSVARAHPRIIFLAVRKAQGLPVIVGAGIKSSEDVKIGLEKGAAGILVASSVILAHSPKKKLLELAKNFR